MARRLCGFTSEFNKETQDIKGPFTIVNGMEALLRFIRTHELDKCLSFYHTVPFEP